MSARRHLRFWLLTALTLAVLIGALELFLRGGQLWSLPLDRLLTSNNDTHTRAVWLLHKPPDPAAKVMLLGASTAIAVFELPGAYGPPKLFNLAVSRGCHAEHIVVADNALQHGHRPELTVVFTWPTCFTTRRDEDEEAALYARRMPLVSQWLYEGEAPKSVDDRLQRWWVTHSAIGRYQYFVNSWIRWRFRQLMKGRPAIRQPLQLPDRREVWGRPWSDDRVRYPLVVALPDAIDFSSRSVALLDILVRRLRASGSKVLLVEAPWGPPMRAHWNSVRDAHHATLERIARGHGAVYLDPNDEIVLADADFNDLFHVTNEAGARYFEPIGRTMTAMLR